MFVFTLGAKKHWLLDPPTEAEREMEGFSNVRGGPRQSSLNAVLDRKHKSAKKKPSIFKGIGSMFRFGKHRKMDFNSQDLQHFQQTEEPGHDNYPHHRVQQENENVHSQPVDTNHNPNERIQEQQQLLQQREQIYQRHGFVHRHAEQVQVINKCSLW